ncbi:hypothetical protein C1I93_06115 [Micromonospora endophytica]|uniref:Hsp70 protein n=1 Tax=Micromonospora endophytica TaxID=515350 RepID=A0A2W2D102_9ACTN|nr:hypothetical protein C1I93_06115 [Micromonospora endophytica]RIW43032.1 hypothetical protein D3H59_21675 [Micromonospora endophytica]
MVVSIDFGTHGSGYAYVVVSPHNDDPRTRDKNIVVSSGWPDSPQRTVKDLSAVVTNAAGGPVDWGYTAKYRWSDTPANRRAKAGLHGFAYAFKMALSPQPETRSVPQAEGAVDLDDEPALRVLVAGMLRRMRISALSQIRADVGEIRERDIRWCVTVPAIWSAGQRQFMREAIARAGFTDVAHVLLGVEPEVAALYCLTTPGRALDGRGANTDFTIMDGVRVVVVDCGGGTVDISAYQAQKRHGQTVLGEIGTGSIGGALGSQYVNQQFRRQVLTDRFGAEVLARWEAGPQRRLLNAMEDEWDAVKAHLSVAFGPGEPPQITSNPMLEIPAPLWAALPARVRDRLTDLADDERYLRLTSVEVQALLDRVVEPIIDLIATKLDEVRGESDGGPIVLVLVGGFANNEYLRRRVRHRFDGLALAMRPQQPREAVLRGGVHFGYAPEQIWQRRSARTYGLAQSLEFRPGIDDRQRLIIDHENVWRCTGRFKVLVTRGAPVPAQSCVVAETFPTLRNQETLELGFYWTDKTDPQYVDEADVFPLNRMLVDIRATTGLPIRQRAVRLELYFGETTIRAVAINQRTGAKAEVKMLFDPLFANIRHGSPN